MHKKHGYFQDDLAQFQAVAEKCGLIKLGMWVILSPSLSLSFSLPLLPPPPSSPSPPSSLIFFKVKVHGVDILLLSL
jgi:hypothetical protein